MTSHSPSTKFPSHKHAFKSSFFTESEYWDADVKVDYDTKVNPISIIRIAKFLKRTLSKNAHGIAGYRIYIFKTGKGHHVRIWWSRSNLLHIPATAVLRFQRDLNDDPMRQKFNAARVKRGEPYWNVLWNIKIRNGKIVSKEERCLELENELTIQSL
jgi:hypothetical protein